MNEFDPSLHNFSHLVFIDNPFIDAIIDSIRLSEHDGEMKIEQRYQKIKTDCKKQSAIIKNFKNIFLESLDEDDAEDDSFERGDSQSKSINQKILDIIKEVEDCKDEEGSSDAFQHFKVPQESQKEPLKIGEKSTKWHSLAYNQKKFKILLFKLDLFKVKITQSTKFRGFLGKNNT